MTTILHGLTHVTAFGPVWVVLITLVGLPLANELVQRSPARAQSLLQFIAHMVLVAPGVGSLIAKFPVVGDLLYIFSPQDKTGIPTPLLYKPKSSKLAPPPSPPVAALLPFLLIPMLLLQGCGFGTCMLGKLKASYQTVIEQAAVDLMSADYTALLAQLATEVGPDVVNCAVQAIVTYEQSKQQKAPAGAKAATPNLVLDHGQIYLNSHKPVACAERRAS